MEHQKRCKGECGKVKPMTEFYDRLGGKDGKFTKCKECMKAKSNRHPSKPKEIASKASEQDVIDLLRNQGVYAAPGKCSEWKWCDVVAWGCVRVEVKRAKQDENGCFMFSSTPHQRKRGFTADLVVTICEWKDKTSYHVFPANHPVFYNGGKMKQGFWYDPFPVSRNHGRGGRMTNAIMNEHKDKWELVEAKRLDIMNVLVGNEIVITNPNPQLSLFDIPA
jgi:hypothetical protein